MIHRKLVAFPESQRVLATHLLASPLMAVQFGILGMIPVLLRRDFGASALEVTVASAAIPFTSVPAIFWNAVYGRLRPGSYLLTIWLLTVLPLVVWSVCGIPSVLLIATLVFAGGMSGINPVTADILRSCYPPAKRSKIFSVLKMLEIATVMLSAFGIGVWLDHDRHAYKFYFPLAVALIGMGMAGLHRISRQTLFEERAAKAAISEPLFSSVLGSCREMVRVLRRDARFRRFETAFGVYGFAWMTCVALLPFVSVEVLHLTYSEFAWSTQVVQFTVIIALLVPVGHLTDRAGPIRIAVWSFALLSVYPLGMMLSRNVWELAAVMFVYGIAMSAIQVVWTMGPVTLARNASEASQYLSIHGTAVTALMLLAQFPAVGLYSWSNRIWPPLAVAAALFMLGTVLMSRLERECRRPQPAEEPELTAVG